MKNLSNIPLTLHYQSLIDNSRLAYLEKACREQFEEGQLREVLYTVNHVNIRYHNIDKAMYSALFNAIQTNIVLKIIDRKQSCSRI